MWEGRRWSRT
uniref:Uncharacterized protein n=1 Tax=Anguilla anguilla TaxID=7936 RepID=A0A0E9RWU3_ANGAN